MGGRLVPPRDELMAPVYAQSPDKSDLWWRNILENPTTVQFDHRVLVSNLCLLQEGLLTIKSLGNDDIYSNRSALGLRKFLPYSQDGLATCSEEGDSSRFCDGQYPTRTRYLHTSVSGARSSSSCPPSWKRHAPLCDDPCADLPPQTRSGCTSLEGGVAWCKG
jgi:hypothetical protein